MPFKSKAQLRKFAQLVKEGKMSRATFEEWLRETPNIKKLPERVKKKKKKKGRSGKNVKRYRRKRKR